MSALSKAATRRRSPKIKIANRFRPGAEMIRVDFVFIFSFATSQGGVKGTKISV
jgi:hypothetical protein